MNRGIAVGIAVVALVASTGCVSKKQYEEAQGKLVAASDVGGHRELIEDGVTGTLFAPDDAQAIADALAKLLENRGIWAERRRTARIFVEIHRNWSSNILRYEPVYQRLLRGAA